MVSILITATGKRDFLFSSLESRPDLIAVAVMLSAEKSFEEIMKFISVVNRVTAIQIE